MDVFSRLVRLLIQWPSLAVVGMLRLYHSCVSPFLGPICRFEPSCSVYAMEVIHSFGLIHGGWLSVKRLCKCHPFHPGGTDLPPQLSR